MNEKELLCEVADNVATLTFNRPEVKNAFNDTMREQLLGHLEEFAGDASVRCIVLTGAGDAFCAGGDIASMADLQASGDTTVVAGRIQVASQVVQLIRRMPQPVIAAIHGPAAGGGMNLALACDIRLGSERALFAESFVRIGLVPDWGGFYFLTQLVGTAKAMELMLTGDRVGADDAYALGLLNRVFPVDRFHEEVGQYAQRLASGPAQTQARIKAGVYLGASGSLEDALAYEHRTQSAIFLGADAREGIKAFLEKRAPDFKAS